MNVIQEDREAVYVDDLLRSLQLIALAAFMLWLFIRKKVKSTLLLLGLGILIVVDLTTVAHRYVNADDFVRSRQVARPFQANGVDQQIQKDTGVFRVFDPSEGLNGARTSYFHSSIGGYHAAKPARLQDLFEFHLYQNNLQVLNMLNVKYIIQEDEQTGESYPGLNEDANGNAWFIERIAPVATADEEILALKDFNSKTTAVLNSKEFPKVVPMTFSIDSTASIELVDHRPDVVQYRSTNNQEGFAVFSEMYYANGWKAYINGKETPHVRVNYTLRGLKIPSGNHQIEFKFEPKVVQTGSTIALASNLVLGVLLLTGLFFGFKNSKKKKAA